MQTTQRKLPDQRREGVNHIPFQSNQLKKSVAIRMRMRRSSIWTVSLQLVAKEAVAHAKGDGGGQAGNLLVVDGVDVCEDVVFALPP